MDEGALERIARRRREQDAAEASVALRNVQALSPGASAVHGDSRLWQGRQNLACRSTAGHGGECDESAPAVPSKRARSEAESDKLTRRLPEKPPRVFVAALLQAWVQRLHESPWQGCDQGPSGQQARGSVPPCALLSPHARMRLMSSLGDLMIAWRDDGPEQCPASLFGLACVTDSLALEIWMEVGMPGSAAGQRHEHALAQAIRQHNAEMQKSSGRGSEGHGHGHGSQSSMEAISKAGHKTVAGAAEYAVFVETMREHAGALRTFLRGHDSLHEWHMSARRGEPSALTPEHARRVMLGVLLKHIRELANVQDGEDVLMSPASPYHMKPSHVNRQWRTMAVSLMNWIEKDSRTAEEQAEVEKAGIEPKPLLSPLCDDMAVWHAVSFAFRVFFLYPDAFTAPLYQALHFSSVEAAAVIDSSSPQAQLQALFGQHVDAMECAYAAECKDGAKYTASVAAADERALCVMAPDAQYPQLRKGFFESAGMQQMEQSVPTMRLTLARMSVEADPTAYFNLEKQIGFFDGMEWARKWHEGMSAEGERMQREYGEGAPDPYAVVRARIDIARTLDSADLSSHFSVPEGPFWRKVPPSAMCTVPRCAACGECEKKLMVCGRCTVPRYCSADCQRKHWKIHKAFCKHLKLIKGKAIESAPCCKG